MQDLLSMLKYLMLKGCRLIMSMFKAPFGNKISMKNISEIPSMIGKGGLAFFVDLIENGVEFADPTVGIGTLFQCGIATTVFPGSDRVDCGNSTSSYSGIETYDGGDAT